MNTDWLKDLKVGDKVVYDDGYRLPQYQITTIIKITPTGIIRTSDGKSWNNLGSERGVGNDAWKRKNYLQPYTNEVAKYIKRKKTIELIKQTDWETLPTEQLANVLGITQLYKKEV